MAFCDLHYLKGRQFKAVQCPLMLQYNWSIRGHCKTLSWRFLNVTVYVYSILQTSELPSYKLVWITLIRWHSTGRVKLKVIGTSFTVVGHAWARIWLTAPYIFEECSEVTHFCLQNTIAFMQLTKVPVAYNYVLTISVVYSVFLGHRHQFIFAFLPFKINIKVQFLCSLLIVVFCAIVSQSKTAKPRMHAVQNQVARELI